MSTTAQPAHRPPSADGPADADPGPRTGPIRRIIAASLATGLVGALTLTVVVFGGEPEHVITGSALAFAFGWALLAVLSIRMTASRSAGRVPAAGMAVTGLGLVILAPGDGPRPPRDGCGHRLLALAIWMGFRVRRLAAGSGRWLLYPVVAVIAAAAVGGAVETVGLTADQRANAMPGHLFDVGGYRLHLDCSGSGGPTVVLNSGLGAISANWARIVPAVAGTTRVCAYDRAGQGWSDDAPHLQDGLAVAADLHALLDRAGEHGPYVLVGHRSATTR